MSIEKRTYADSAKAKAAMDELFAKGFTEVKASFKPDKVLVAVNAPSGKGTTAAKILESHGPLEADDEEWEKEGVEPAAGGFASKIKNPATPLSDLLGWKVLSDKKGPFWPAALIDDPAPLSNKFGWSVLSKDK
jgi:hypothetical protein